MLGVVNLFVKLKFFKTMKEEKKIQNEELQSRREFFKKAAKGVLPVLGAIALMNMPLLSQALEKGESPDDCSGSCSYGCGRSCSYGCSSSCSGSCSGGCKGSCMQSCSGTCQSGCKGGCSYGSKGW